MIPTAAIVKLVAVLRYCKPYSSVNQRLRASHHEVSLRSFEQRVSERKTRHLAENGVAEAVRDPVYMCLEIGGRGGAGHDHIRVVFEIRHRVPNVS